MRYLVAVSGGIDSVVLLDMLASEKTHELIVAHFDHGIREDSAADARFVQELAKKYGLSYVTTREELGQNASEERARLRRYTFLRQAAAKHEAQLVTAHHGDDIVETIAINLIRGTGWRGVAVLDAADIHRPLLAHTKVDIRTYALDNRLEWVEDSTNASIRYLRNRLRWKIAKNLSDENQRLIRRIWQRQIALKKSIDEEVMTSVHSDGEYSRYFFTQLDEPVACELLKVAIFAKYKTGPTRPQLLRALLAVKTARANTQFEVAGRMRLCFTTRTFIVQTP